MNSVNANGSMSGVEPNSGKQDNYNVSQSNHIEMSSARTELGVLQRPTSHTIGMSQLDEAVALLEEDINKIQETGDTSIRTSDKTAKEEDDASKQGTVSGLEETGADDVHVEIGCEVTTAENAIVKPKRPKRKYAVVVLFFSLVEIIIMFAQMSVAGWQFESIEKNFFLGPKNSASLLLQFGAKYGPVMKDNGSESYRFFTAIFVHVGFVHLLTNLSMQLSLCAKVEQVHGTLRSLIIYFVAGICGNIMSAVFVPNSIECGSSGSIFGYMGVIAADYFKNRKRIKRRKYILFVLVLTVALSFAVGLLPVIDNFAHLGGFLAGIFLGVALIPDIRIQRQTSRASTSQVDDTQSQYNPPTDHLPSENTVKNSSKQTESSIAGQIQVAPLTTKTKLKNWLARKHPRLSYIMGFLGPKLPTRPWWYKSWLKRTFSAVLLLVLSILGLVAFYDWIDARAGWCPWCLFFSCLPVFEWCKEM